MGNLLHNGMKACIEGRGTQMCKGFHKKVSPHNGIIMTHPTPNSNSVRIVLRKQKICGNQPKQACNLTPPRSPSPNLLYHGKKSYAKRWSDTNVRDSQKSVASFWDEFDSPYSSTKQTCMNIKKGFHIKRRGRRSRINRKRK